MEQNKNYIGYARVSSKHQNLDSQVDQLKAKGCKKIFTDKINGQSQAKPGWNKLIEYIRPGEAIVITELSRISRSLSHLLELIAFLKKKEIELISIRESIDTYSATGRFFLSMMGALSQMELELKRERTEAGRASAKARGKTGGRPSVDPLKLEQAKILYEKSDKTAGEICESLGIGRRTFFYHLKKTTDSKKSQSSKR